MSGLRTATPVFLTLCFPSPPESKGGGRATPPPRRWNFNSAGAGLVHTFVDSRRAVCELLASHNNTQILVCFPRQLD